MEILEILTEQVLAVDKGEIAILDVAEQGPPGPQGPQGVPGAAGGTVLQYPAGEALGGHRIVILNDAEQAIYADNTIASHASKVLGMTTGGANAGDTATIQTGGEITEPSWNWAINQPIYLGTNGLLTQTQPATGFSLIAGFPIASDKIFIKLREPIFLI